MPRLIRIVVGVVMAPGFDIFRARMIEEGLPRQRIEAAFLVMSSSFIDERLWIGGFLLV